MIDQDALTAGIDLVARSGASDMTFGWLHDDVPVEQADWWASATYRGAKLMVEHHVGPVQAVEALARRILDGGMCNHCKQPVTLSDAEPGCRWTREGKRWKRGCE